MPAVMNKETGYALDKIDSIREMMLTGKIKRI
jgi:hypothetical protein